MVCVMYNAVGQSMPILMKNHTAEELVLRLSADGVTLRLARRLQAALFRAGTLPLSLPEVSPALLGRVRERIRIPHVRMMEKAVSPTDGCIRYVFEGAGPGRFESVAIPLLHRPAAAKLIVCVSSQVGCSLGCAFCATGRLGFERDLAAWEMVDQVVKVSADSALPLGGVVFMGMGEPLLNFDAVLRAAGILSEPCGLALAGKSITISTAGIGSALRRFVDARRSYRLIVSLNSADPAVRRRLMPVEAAHPMAEWMSILRDYHAGTGRRVTLAWTMISGVNTREEDARQLARLTHGLPVQIDLIDVNDPSGRFKAPSPGERCSFRDALRRHVAAPVVRRYSGGADIQAACGMLAGGAVCEGTREPRAAYRRGCS